MWRKSDAEMHAIWIDLSRKWAMKVQANDASDEETRAAKLVANAFEKNCEDTTGIFGPNCTDDGFAQTVSGHG